MSDNPTNFELTVEKLVYGGDGLARRDGEVVLLPFVAAGERVLVKPANIRKGLVRAELVDILEPSLDRTAAACPVYTRCGGCHYQHLHYEAELQVKREILAETLRRTAHLEPPAEIEAISGPPLGYRNRVQLRTADGRLGFLEARTHNLCAIESCPTASPRLNETIQVLRQLLRDRRWPRFIQEIELFTNEESVQVTVLESQQPVAKHFFEWLAERIPGAAAGWLDYSVGPVTYRVGYRSFFQVNRHLIGSLVDCATAGIETGTVLDLYAGAGLFSIPLALRGAQVSAVESGAAARDLEANAARAGVRLGCHKLDVALFLESLAETPDCAIADPPRQGLGPKAVQELLRLRPRDLRVISCDPATLARDLAGLTAGGYRIEAMTLVDLFPRTFHLETVTRLALD